jgi:hypothetical protein
MPSVAKHARRWQLASAGLAAALLVSLVIWQFASRSNNTPVPVVQAPAPDALLANVFKHQLKLAKESKPQDQVEPLADLADDLQTTAQAMSQAADAKEGREALSDWYKEVVQAEVERAQKLKVDGDFSAQKRKELLLQLAGRLDRVAKEGDESFRTVADDASKELKALAGQQFSRLPGADLLERSVASGVHVSQGLVRPLLPNLTAVRGNAPASPTPEEYAKSFRLNRDLLKVVVAESVNLARAENDPIRRAECCGRVARSLSVAIRQAATEREKGRVEQLGDQLKTQLKDGVARNVEVAIEQVPQNAPPESLSRLTKAAGDILDPLETQLKENLEDVTDSATKASMKDTLSSFSDRHDRIKRTLRERGRQAEPKMQPRIHADP